MTKPDLYIKMVFDAWNTQLAHADKLFNLLSDKEISEEIAPGKNSGVYLLGHLIAVHDSLFHVLGIGDKLYPELEEIFIKNPDKSGLQKPAINDLKNYWKKVNAKLTEHFSQFSPEDWFQKHSLVSDKDFEKQPHRNKLNVIINRTNHLAYHIGQLIFLAK